MGLDISHNAFHGAYSSFMRFRLAIVEAVGGTYERPSYLLPDGYEKENAPGLHEFLSHSDSDGEISPESCKVIADELEAILPKIEEMDLNEYEWGHITRDGGILAVTKRFIEGCRKAHEANEPLNFH
jgi:hypothetical protein